MSAMQSGEHVDFILDFFELLQDKNLEILSEKFEKTGRVVFPGRSDSSSLNIGIDKIRRLLKRTFAFMSEIHFEPRSIVAAGDRIAAEWTFSGSTKKNKLISACGTIFIDLTRSELIEEIRVYFISDILF